MKHPTLLELSMYVDEALVTEQAAFVQAHISNCDRCAMHVRQLEREASLLRKVLVASPVVIPEFRPAPSPMELFKGALIFIGLAWMTIWLWQSLFNPAVREFIGWFRPSGISESAGMAVEAVFYVSERGSQALSTLYTLAASALGVAALSWLFMHKPQWRGTFCLGLCFLLIGIATPDEAGAIEIRREDKGHSMTIPAGTVIEDSVVMAGQTIVVDGTVDGDLFTAGQRVIINGRVNGNLFTFAQDVSIEGTVSGSLIGFGKTIELEGEVQGSVYNMTESTVLNNAAIMVDLWAYSGSLKVDEESRIQGSATTLLGSAILEGEIGRDLTGFGDRFEISGRVGKNVTAGANTLSLLDGAVIGGDVVFRNKNEDRLEQSEGAVVNGTITIENPTSSMQQPRNRFLTVKFYINQLIRLASAFVIGLCLFALIPAWRRISLGGGMQTLKEGGVGFLALISMPVIAVILAVTIIGLPVAVVVLVSWALLWYLAKIVLAWVLGKLIMPATPDSSFPLILLVGLVAVMIAVNIPVIGVILSVCMTWVGAGLLALKVMETFSRKRA